MSVLHQAELNIETEASNAEFYELLDLAIDTTLSDRSVFDRHLETIRNREEELEYASRVQRVGMWAITYGVKDTVIPGPITEVELDDAIDEHIESDRLSLPFEREVQMHIEAFGAAILEEAFNCLGEDAEEQARRLREATSHNEAIDAFNWLAVRFESISDIIARKNNQQDKEETSEENEESSDEEPEQYFYHPARLSPNFIGIYPDLNVEPTCLAYSILAAAFFERAGIPYAHAGVISTAKDESRMGLRTIALEILLTAERENIGIGDELKARLYGTFKENHDIVFKFTGFHSVVLAQIQNDLWAQVDPNYESNIVWPNETDLHASGFFERLEQKQGIAQGLEQSFTMLRSLFSAPYTLSAMHLADTTPAIEDTDNFLSNVPPETAYAEIIANYFQDFLTIESPFARLNLFSEIVDYCNEMDLDPMKYLQDRIHESLINYVFTEAADGDFSDCIRRCQRDPAYRLRRAEDLALAPLMTMLSMMSRHGHEVINDNIPLPHAVIEAGPPAYRIGASVLSDFAVYCGDELPLSFWMTYWPSQVSFAEHYGNASTPPQQALSEQMMGDLKNHPWHYYHFRDIIGSVHE